MTTTTTTTSTSAISYIWILFPWHRNGRMWQISYNETSQDQFQSKWSSTSIQLGRGLHATAVQGVWAPKATCLFKRCWNVTFWVGKWGPGNSVAKLRSLKRGWKQRGFPRKKDVSDVILCRKKPSYTSSSCRYHVWIERDALYWTVWQKQRIIQEHLAQNADWHRHRHSTTIKATSILNEQPQGHLEYHPH